MSKKSILFILLTTIVIISVLAFSPSIFGRSAQLPASTGFGIHPELALPDQSFIPIIKVAKAIGWTADEKPTAADGMDVVAFARGLDHPRWLYVLPNGDDFHVDAPVVILLPLQEAKSASLPLWTIRRP